MNKLDNEQVTKLYRNCRMRVMYFDNQKTDDIPGEVRFEEDTIVISYEGADGHEVHIGKEESSGHYITFCKETGGRGVYHRLPGSNILNGYWKEVDGFEGMTRIDLGKPFSKKVM